jgi:hypothetical protein
MDHYTNTSWKNSIVSTRKQIEANKRNCLRSTGAKTPAGRLKSSMNALKHGRRSTKSKLFRENSYMYEARRLKSMALTDARNDIQAFMAAQNAALSLKIERIQRADAAEYTSFVENADAKELEGVHDLRARSGSGGGGAGVVSASLMDETVADGEPTAVMTALADAGSGSTLLADVENATNEANSHDDVINPQTRESVEVVLDSGAISGLDTPRTKPIFHFQFWILDWGHVECRGT